MNTIMARGRHSVHDQILSTELALARVNHGTYAILELQKVIYKPWHMYILAALCSISMHSKSARRDTFS